MYCFVFRLLLICPLFMRVRWIFLTESADLARTFKSFRHFVRSLRKYLLLSGKIQVKVSTCIIKTLFFQIWCQIVIYISYFFNYYFLLPLSSVVASHFLSCISLIASLIFNFQINWQICLSFQADVGDLSTH